MPDRERVQPVRAQGCDSPLAQCQPRSVFLFHLAAASCRTDRVSVESLRADGYQIASDVNPWGGVWMKKEIDE